MPRNDIGITINSRLADNEISDMLQPLAQMRYTATRQLGRGSEGIVFMARNDLDGNYVAIKVCNRKQCPKNALGEFWYWAYVYHPNCLRVREKFTFDNLVYYVMEFTDNLTLLDWIQDQWNRPPKQKRRNPNEELLKKWSRQLLLAVQYLHERGLYHLDIKPDNIFMDRKWELKLGDFGFLRSEYDKSHPLTLGCPGYMPPEGLKEKVPLTVNLEKVDIWSVGATIYELLTGRVVSGVDFELCSLQRKKLMVNLKKNLVTMKAETPLYPGGQELVLNMLQWSPGDRPSATELLMHPWLRVDLSRMTMPSDESLSKDSGLWKKLYAYWASVINAEEPDSPAMAHSSCSDNSIEQKRLAIKRKRNTEPEDLPAKRAKWTRPKVKFKSQRVQRRP